MKAITYQVRLLEPVLVTSLSGDPNSAASFDYLPGSVLRGFFIGRYLQQRQVGLAIDADARRLFLRGDTRWLNAYPLDRLGKRCLPTPRSLHRIKNGNEDDVYDLAIDPQDESDEQWTKAGAAFCQFVEGRVRLVEPERQISVHTARTRRYGRARNDDKLNKAKGDVRGAVYRYDALAAGQVFEAAVLCDDADEAEIRKLLVGKVTLGKSLNGGYGQAVIENVSKPGAQWRGEYALPGSIEASATDDIYTGKLIITLLSDALLRDERSGQHIVEAEEVGRLLEGKLGGQLSLIRAFISRAVLGGFNRKWGLPLPQAHAIEAGSVFVLNAENISRQKLNDLLATGIGERRAEGFGRLAANWQTKAELTEDKGKKDFKTTAVTLAGADAELAERVAGRILRHRLDQRVTAAGLKFTITGPPNTPRKSQLARLRGLIHEELMKPKPDVQRVIDFIDELKKRSTTRRQFSQASVSETPLDKWLMKQLGEIEDSPWRGVVGIKSEQATVGLGGIKAAPTEQMKSEYLLRYLDAFLARAAKQSGKD